MKEDTTSGILKRLEDQKKEEGGLPLLLEFYYELLETQSEALKRLAAPKTAWSKDTILKRIQNGLPPIGFNELDPYWPLVQDFFPRVINVFAKYPGLFGEPAARLKEKDSGRVITKKAIEAWFNGKDLPSIFLGGASKNLMSAIIQATIQPFLANYARALISHIEQELWRRGYCPICGGVPDLALIKGEHGARWLLCSRCDTEWLFQRLECPYCGTQEQNDLAFFTDDNEQYRLYVCEQCKCYLKAIDLRKAQSEILPPLERIYTLDLDTQARERGYHSCQKPAVKSK
ncbi:MAG: hypothetical protein A2144_00655 [Chloroflexi bacterium RBG_16_50_9]|nr:MAG: hypothetical protein A2144_00655 [Chloroflexi bacterium RBG_16_50_9]